MTTNSQEQKIRQNVERIKILQEENRGLKKLIDVNRQRESHRKKDLEARELIARARLGLFLGVHTLNRLLESGMQPKELAALKYYQGGVTLQEISNDIGIGNRGRAGQLRDRAVRKMAHRSRLHLWNICPGWLQKHLKDTYKGFDLSIHLSQQQSKIGLDELARD